MSEMTLRKAALVNAAGKYLKVVLTMLVNAILARILSPSDFGIVAVITVFTTFFAMLSDMGLGAAIVQKKDLDRNDINSLFTYSAYVSLGLCVIFLACAWPIALWYGRDTYLRPTLLLTAALLFNALNMVPSGLLNRDKKFVSIAIRTVTVYLVSAVIAIILAFRGWSYYALVVQAILAAVLQFAWNWLSTRPHLMLHPSRQAIAKVNSYSAYQLAFNVVNYFARNLDNLLTGKFLGEAKLGNYNKAYNLMLFPVNNLAGVISPVLHPMLSDYQDKPQEIYRRYMPLVKILFSIGALAGAISYLAAPEIIGILYGPQWNDCVRCFQLLAIAIIPQMVNASAGAVFQSLGNTRLLFVSTCINTAITTCAITGALFFGGSIELLSLCVAISYLFHFAIAFILLIRKGFGYGLGEFLKQLTPQIAITAALIAAIAVYRFSFETVMPDYSDSSLAQEAIVLSLKILYLGGIFLTVSYLTGELIPGLRLFFRRSQLPESGNQDGANN